MASITRKRSVVTLERKLGVTRMLEDGKSQRSVSSVLYSELWAFSHIRAPIGPTLPGLLRFDCMVKCGLCGGVIL